MYKSEILKVMENADGMRECYNDLYCAFYTVRHILLSEARAIRREYEEGKQIDPEEFITLETVANFLFDREDDFCEWYRVAKAEALEEEMYEPDEKFFTSANPWDAPGMKLSDFL